MALLPSCAGGENPWPPDPSEAEALATGITDLLGVGYFEPLLALLTRNRAGVPDCFISLEPRAISTLPGTRSASASPPTLHRPKTRRYLRPPKGNLSMAARGRRAALAHRAHLRASVWSSWPR